jgi:hypothetical protein
MQPISLAWLELSNMALQIAKPATLLMLLLHTKICLFDLIVEACIYSSVSLVLPLVSAGCTVYL